MKITRPMTRQPSAEMKFAYQDGDGGWIFWDGDYGEAHTKMWYPPGRGLGFECPYKPGEVLLADGAQVIVESVQPEKLEDGWAWVVTATLLSQERRLMNEQPTISVLVEIPEGLHQAVQTYLRSIQGLGDNQDSVFTKALALYMTGKGIQGLIPSPLSNDGLGGLFTREG